MSRSNEVANEDTFNRMVLICSAITAGVGILGISGWITGLRILASFGPKFISMAPGVALAFLLLEGTWFLYELMPAQKFRRICALASVLFILLVALLNLIQSFTGTQMGIEEILVRRVLALNPQAYGGEIRPVALPVGVAFVALSVGLIATAGPDYFPLRLFVREHITDEYPGTGIGLAK